LFISGFTQWAGEAAGAGANATGGLPNTKGEPIESQLTFTGEQQVNSDATTISNATTNGSHEGKRSTILKGTDDALKVAPASRHSLRHPTS
jgi:hypothetical protein